MNLIHILQKDCVHEMKKDFNCDLCSFTTSYKKSLIQHIDTIHEKKRDFKCSMCDYSASQNVNLEQHVKSIHEKKKDFKCLKCDYSTSVKSNLTRHFSRHHEPKKHRVDDGGSGDRVEMSKCQLCEVFLESDEGLTKHLVSRHNVRNQLNSL